MERKATIAEAGQIMGNDFIGEDEIARIADRMGIMVPDFIPEIPFMKDDLEQKKGNYILILGVPLMKDGDSMSLNKLRTLFGIDPKISEPCFYNQDWYLKEEFASAFTLESRWYLIRKELISESRGRNMDNVNQIETASFPSALLCAYTFFCYFFHSGRHLWKDDYIWCNDLDSNGDRIYVGRYFDISGVSKNGFSIHRHLKIRKNYGLIDIM